MHHNLLLFRMIITNACGFALLVWAWTLGYVQQVFAGDISHISYVIAALFAVGLVSTFWRTLEVNSAANFLASRPAYVPPHMRRRAAQMSTKAAHIDKLSLWMVTLGLIGNVVGFVLALRGVDIGSVGTADGSQKVAAELLAGMGVAFYSTLTGAVLALWTDINKQMLETATALYLEDLR